jgi:hypothetical protein
MGRNPVGYHSGDGNERLGGLKIAQAMASGVYELILLATLFDIFATESLAHLIIPAFRQNR